MGLRFFITGATESFLPLQSDAEVEQGATPLLLKRRGKLTLVNNFIILYIVIEILNDDRLCCAVYDATHLTLGYKL